MKKLRNHEGFTLLEMVIVVTIISILFLLTVPNIQKTLTVVDDKGCQALTKTVDSAILQYRLETGENPGSVNDLIAAGRSRSRTAGLSATSGFALAELLVSILIMAVLMRMAGSLHAFHSEQRLSFADQYLRCQSEALLRGAYVTYADEQGNTRPEIRFNGQGNINRARAITFEDSSEELVIELGPGRLLEH